MCTFEKKREYKNVQITESERDRAKLERRLKQVMKRKAYKKYEGSFGLKMATMVTMEYERKRKIKRERKTYKENILRPYLYSLFRWL